MRFVSPILFAVASLVLLNGCSESSHPHPAQSHANHTPAVQPQAQGHDEHDHGHDATQTLTLNNGSKWETDEALRHAMGSILTLVEPHLHTPASADDFAHLAHGVHSNIEYMVQNCRLEPQADAALHTIIGAMFEGIALLQGEHGEAVRQEGVGRIAQALQNYGEYFDHPDFAVPHAH